MDTSDAHSGGQIEVPLKIAQTAVGGSGASAPTDTSAAEDSTSTEHVPLPKSSPNKP